MSSCIEPFCLSIDGRNYSVALMIVLVLLHDPLILIVLIASGYLSQ
ncbi:MAG: hypothetical protein LBT81_03760 [Helicobacteraceae bacterium]|nr:hypothetical protein [Helicobacteraceae bacterium]